MYFFFYCLFQVLDEEDTGDSTKLVVVQVVGRRLAEEVPWLHITLAVSCIVQNWVVKDIFGKKPRS